MSASTLIAFGALLIASGSAGYERYQLQGRSGRAWFDAMLSILGVLLLENGIRQLS